LPQADRAGAGVQALVALVWREPARACSH